MMRTKKSIICILASLLLLISVLSVCQLNANAAVGDQASVLGGQVVGKITEQDNTSSISAPSTNSLSGSVTGGSFLSKTATFTITNNSGSKAKISFDVSVTGSYNYFRINGESFTSGTFTSALLDNGGSITLKLSAKSKKTPTFTLSNITLDVAAATSDVTFEFDSSMGIITVGGESVSSGFVCEGVSLDSGVAVTASAKSGYAFLGWINTEDHSVIPTDENNKMYPTKAMTVKAVFAKNDGTGTAWFLVDGTHLFDDLNAADTQANGSGTIVLMNSGTLPSGENYTISKGNHFLVPNSETDTGAFGGEPAIQISGNSTANPAKAFRILTVPSGTTITCYGEINVNGHRSANGQPFNGHVIGDYGKIILGTESKTFSDPKESDLTAQLIIGSGGALYCYGYITGSGMVDVQKGGTVHELLQMADWPGGSNGISWKGDSYNNLFLCTQYYVQNIEAPLKIASGATQYVEAVITISLGSLGSTEIKFSAKFIGTSDCMFIMAGDGYLLRIYDQQNDRMHYHFKGGSCTIGTLSMSYSIYNITTENSIMAITNNISVYIEDNATFNINKPVAILPGAEVVIEDGGIANIENSAIYIYDVNDWKGITNNAMSSYFNRVQEAINGGWAPDDVNTDPKTNPLPYVATLNSISPRATRYYYNPSNEGQGMSNPKPITTSGRVVVNGTVNIKTGGYVYTSSDSASEDKVITGTGTIVHNGSLATAEKTITSGTGTYATGVKFNNALGNLAGVGEMKQFDNGNTTYHGIVINGVNWWYINTAKVDATCVEDGYTKYYCSDETKFISVAGDLATGNHTWGTDCICDVCTIFKFYASNVHLGNNLNMMFAFPVAGLGTNTAANCYIEIVRTYSLDKDGNIKATETTTVPISEWYTYDEDYFVVVYSGFAAKEMCDTITLTVYNGDKEAISVSLTDSLRAYCLRMLTESTNDLQKTLIKDMLNYGAACQNYFQYGTNQPLANADLGNYPGTASGDLTLGEGSQVSWGESQLVTDSNISFRLSFADATIENATHYSYTFKGHKGNEVTREKTAISQVITIEELVVADADCTIEVTIYYEDGMTTSFEESIAEYIMRMNTSTADPVYTEFLKFARSSYAYKHPNTEAAT